MAGVMRLVLDTNVWLDWLVFDDPAVAPIREAVAGKRAEVYMDASCEAELARVLAYDLGKHTISAEAQASCIERCRRVATRLDTTGNAVATAPATAIAPATPTALATAPGVSRLPRCSDPDDQKFLELALAANADVLVTKDRALLDLARRHLPFRIAAPQALELV